MITNEGKSHVKRYLAGWTPHLAQSVALGIGNRAESLSDVALQLEVARSSIVLTTYDFINNKLVYKASVPEEFAGKVYEIGLYSSDVDATAGEYGSRLITTFDSGTENWVGALTGTPMSFSSAQTRVGTDSLALNPAASVNLAGALRDVSLDFSGNSGADTFNFAFYVGNANTTAVVVYFLTDANNYYSFALGSQTAGYKIIERAKSTATVTGVPNWNNITEIRVAVTSGSGGASAVEFDAIRVEDKDSSNLDYVLVARKVLAVPHVRTDGMAEDVEFSLDVNIT